MRVHYQVGVYLPLGKFPPLNYPLLLFEDHCTGMTDTTKDTDIEEIKKENDRIIMKIFGLQYEKYFSQEHQDEK